MCATQHHPHGKFTENLVEPEKILETLAVQSGQIIVDAGCGNGYMSKLFAERVAPCGKVFAMDTESYFIETLQNETGHPNLHAMLSDITTSTELDTCSVDVIYISTVLHSFSGEKRQGFINEALRMLKDNGLLAVVEFDKKETVFGPPIQQRYSPEELQQIFPFKPLITARAGEHFYLQTFEKM